MSVDCLIHIITHHIQIYTDYLSSPKPGHPTGISISRVYVFVLHPRAVRHYMVLHERIVVGLVAVVCDVFYVLLFLVGELSNAVNPKCIIRSTYRIYKIWLLQPCFVQGGLNLAGEILKQGHTPPQKNEACHSHVC